MESILSFLNLIFNLPSRGREPALPNSAWSPDSTCSKSSLATSPTVSNSMSIDLGKEILSDYFTLAFLLMTDDDNGQQSTERNVLCSARFGPLRLLNFRFTTLCASQEILLAQALKIRDITTTSYSRSSHQSGLSHLLERFKDTKCSDARDKIYALLPIMKYHCPDRVIEVDYTISTTDLFFRVFEFILDESCPEKREAYQDSSLIDTLVLILQLDKTGLRHALQDIPTSLQARGKDRTYFEHVLAFDLDPDP